MRRLKLSYVILSLIDVSELVQQVGDVQVAVFNGGHVGADAAICFVDVAAGETQKPDDVDVTVSGSDVQRCQSFRVRRIQLDSVVYQEAGHSFVACCAGDVQKRVFFL